MLKVEKYEH